jgi:3-dehydroquinate dehydratase/shikimate dehydrogenase
MICISIAQESRRFALADMVNASKQCDLLEVRLDRFGKSPDVGELLAAKPKPVIMSCRRTKDGGSWDGTEDERLAILRQCIVSKADYVEIEHDIADQVRPFPGCKRVISYTNLGGTPIDLADIYAGMQSMKPDVIKLVTRAQTPEEAWPLVQILAKPALPTVAVGLGRPGLMLAVLGRRMASPWTYAALERGMEAYPEQPTVHDLESIYHYRLIERATRLVGVTGASDWATAAIAGLNAAFASLGAPMRCLPLEIGDLRLFRKVIEAIKLTHVVIDAQHREAMHEVALEMEAGARRAGSADLIVHQSGTWSGFHLLDRAATDALEHVLHGNHKTDQPLSGRTVMLIGVNGLARAMAYRVQKHGANVIIASRDKAAAHALAQEQNCRHVQLDAVYTALHDVLIICAEEQRHATLKPKSGETGLHAGYLKPSIAVMDLTAAMTGSDMLRGAAERGCPLVSPRSVLTEHIARWVSLICGKDAGSPTIREAIDLALGEEE